MSGGERKRVALARALLSPAEVQNSVRETLKDQRQARNPVRMASLRAAVFRFDLL